MKNKILDPCCGSRMWHFDKNRKDVLFMDNRDCDEMLCDGRRLVISPGVKADFRDIPFANETFSLVVFDPPHLINVGEHSWLNKKYGNLNPQSWKDDIKQGLSECYRVLKSGGTLIFKWNEQQVSFSDVKPLLPSIPIVGQRRGKTIFLVIFKGDAQ